MATTDTEVSKNGSKPTAEEQSAAILATFVAAVVSAEMSACFKYVLSGTIALEYANAAIKAGHTLQNALEDMKVETRKRLGYCPNVSTLLRCAGVVHLLFPKGSYETIKDGTHAPFAYEFLRSMMVFTETVIEDGKAVVQLRAEIESVAVDPKEVKKLVKEYLSRKIPDTDALGAKIDELRGRKPAAQQPTTPPAPTAGQVGVTLPTNPPAAADGTQPATTTPPSPPAGSVTVQGTGATVNSGSSILPNEPVRPDDRKPAVRAAAAFTAVMGSLDPWKCWTALGTMLGTDKGLREHIPALMHGLFADVDATMRDKLMIAIVHEKKEIDKREKVRGAKPPQTAPEAKKPEETSKDASAAEKPAETTPDAKDGKPDAQTAAA